MLMLMMVMEKILFVLALDNHCAVCAVCVREVVTFCHYPDSLKYLFGEGSDRKSLPLFASFVVLSAWPAETTVGF